MWNIENHRLTREITLDSFAEAMVFIQAVGALATSHDHHPTIINTYRTVRLELTTYDAGNTVTERDHQLAAAIDALLSPP